MIVTVKGSGAHHDIPSVLKVHPDQAIGLQDADGVNHSHLAANNLGSGSGWQQSKQNWIPLAVMGECTWTDCHVLWCSKAVQLGRIIMCWPGLGLVLARVKPKKKKKKKKKKKEKKHSEKKQH